MTKQIDLDPIQQRLENMTDEEKKAITEYLLPQIGIKLFWIGGCIGAMLMAGGLVFAQWWMT